MVYFGERYSITTYEESFLVNPKENNSASYDQQFCSWPLLIKVVLLTSITIPDRDKYKNMQQSHLIIRWFGFFF